MSQSKFKTTVQLEEKNLVLKFIMAQLKQKKNVNISEVLKHFVENDKTEYNVLTRSVVFEAVRILRDEDKAIQSVSSSRTWTFGSNTEERERIEKVKQLLAQSI